MQLCRRTSIERTPMEYGSRVFEKKEYVALKRILNFNKHCEGFLPKDVFEVLRDGLAKALVKNNEEMPRTIVRLNSKVTLSGKNGRTRTVQLVLPSEKNNERGRISVISSLGANLIGLGVGHRVLLGVPHGSNAVEIVKVVSPNSTEVDLIYGSDLLP